MKKNLVISFLLGFVAQVALGQLSEGSKINANTGAGLNSPRAGVFWNSPASDPNIVGQFYLDSTWHEGNVKFTSVIPQFGGWSTDTLNAILIRYNVLNDQLEVLADKSKNDIRVIQGNHLKNFTLKSSENKLTKFDNASTFKAEKKLSGFFETLVNGRLSLIKLYKAKTIKPTYNPGFGTGEKNTIVSIVNDYYVVSNGQPEKINPGKKAFVSLMKDKESDVENFIKTNNLSFKSEDDMVRLFEFYNK